MQPGDTAAIVVLLRGDAEVASWALVTRGRPDVSVADDLARLQLEARRLGCSILLRDPCGELVELLELVGLGDVVPAVVTDGGGLRLEARGEPEGGEEVGVEEVVVPDDPVA